MGEKEVIKTCDSVQRFMDLFILEQIRNEKDPVRVLSNSASEAIQMALEPFVYEDAPVIKNVQNHIIDLAVKRERQGRQQCCFEEEIKQYVHSIYSRDESLLFTKEEIQNKWCSYTDVEKERMSNLTDTYYDILEYLEEKENYLSQGKRK